MRSTEVFCPGWFVVRQWDSNWFSWESVLSRAWTGSAALRVVIWAVGVWISVRETGQLERFKASQRAPEFTGFSEHVGLQLFAIDRVLKQLRQRYRDTGVLPAQANLDGEIGPKAPMLLQAAVPDGAGTAVAGTLGLTHATKVADRSHGIALHADPMERLRVSQPVVGRVSGKTSWQLVRPIISRLGVFEGVIVARIPQLSRA